MEVGLCGLVTGARELGEMCDLVCVTQFFETQFPVK